MFCSPEKQKRYCKESDMSRIASQAQFMFALFLLKLLFHCLSFFTHRAHVHYVEHYPLPGTVVLQTALTRTDEGKLILQKNLGTADSQCQPL
jgi:hypothetical protein